MQRVMVIGGSGSGKSMFSRDLGQRAGLPVIHMDQLFWEPGWVEADQETFLKRVAVAIAQDRWVMEGNYSRTWPSRLARADTVIFLDLPTPLRLYRVVRRIVRNYGQVRTDLSAGCPERFDLEFLISWVIPYRWKARPKAVSFMANLPGQKVALHLRDRAQVTRCLETLKS